MGCRLNECLLALSAKPFAHPDNQRSSISLIMRLNRWHLEELRGEALPKLLLFKLFLFVA
jgi:hypothetical protein